MGFLNLLLFFGLLVISIINFNVNKFVNIGGNI
jgi:hypothetical protein